MSQTTEQDNKDDALPSRGELAAAVEELQTEVADAKRLAQRAQDRLLDAREREQAQQERIADLEATVEDVEQELAAVRERTDLLQTVKRASSMQIDERAAVLIQTLYNEAYANKQSDVESRRPKAAMDYNAAKKALGGSVARATILRTFEKAEELVDNPELMKKVKEDRSSARNTRLRLNLEGGDLPAQIAGQNITVPGEA